MNTLMRAYGEFLDTPASATGIASFAAKPKYNMDDYLFGPSGWLTFNQLFAREMRPGKRPIASPRVGAELRKGDPFGYFLFGGSDVVMLFQNTDITFDAEVGKKYLQGQRLGAAS